MDKSKTKVKRPKVMPWSDLERDLDHAVIRGDKAEVDRLRSEIATLKITAGVLEKSDLRDA